MSNDDYPYSTPAVWSYLYHELKDTPWEEEDLDNYRFHHNEPSKHAAAVNALKYVYDLAADWKGVTQEDAVLTTLRAAHEHHGSAFLTPHQVKEMARNFDVHYTSYDEPMDQYLWEHCGEVRWGWLNDHGKREIEKAVVNKDAEIWIDDPDLTGVWVFSKPGR